MYKIAVTNVQMAVTNAEYVLLSLSIVGYTVYKSKPLVLLCCWWDDR